MGDLYKDGIDASKLVDEIFIGVLFMGERGEIVETYPSLEGEHTTSARILYMGKLGYS